MRNSTSLGSGRPAEAESGPAGYCRKTMTDEMVAVEK
jgi:hypothetical protein